MLIRNKILFLYFYLYGSVITNGLSLSGLPNTNNLIPVNILLLLPMNNTYKFSLNKVLYSLNMAIDEIKTTNYGSKFDIDIMPDSCDCTSIKAPVNAMENIYRKRNHTKRFQAVFGPMCD
jgi:hypothetical protein